MPQNPFTIATPVFSYKTGRKLTKAALYYARQLLFDFVRWFWKRKWMILLFGPAAKRIYPISVYIPKKLIYNGNRKTQRRKNPYRKIKRFPMTNIVKMSVVSIQI